MDSITPPPKKTNPADTFWDPKKSSRLWIWLVVIIVVLGLSGMFFANDIYSLFRGQNVVNDLYPLQTPPDVRVHNGKLVKSIPQKVLDNKFGFLSGGEPENSFVGDVGGAWVRPHPGPFLWDAMQKNKTAEIDFTATDDIIKNQQQQNYGTLATLWPFAEWDQKMGKKYGQCAVSKNDEFLPDSKQSLKKGRPDYLPLHRCNPTDWTTYEKWVKAVVERYDGDGKDDVSGLLIPIKYWEVMNEPDLAYNVDDPEMSDRLNFYKQGPAEYAQLLIRTGAAIRAADPSAKILIAGAAGGDSRFLNFYKQVFQNPQTHTAFDYGNVHCISNDQESHDFNVGAYKKILKQFNLSQDIWVTEAESIVSSDADLNASATKLSTENAIKAGAVRIFFTRYEFTTREDLNDKPMPVTNIKKTISGSDPTKAYQEIINSIK